MLLNPVSKIVSQNKWSSLFKSKSYHPLFEHREMEMERQTSVIKSNLAKKKTKKNKNKKNRNHLKQKTCK